MCNRICQMKITQQLSDKGKCCPSRPKSQLRQLGRSNKETNIRCGTWRLVEIRHARHVTQSFLNPILIRLKLLWTRKGRLWTTEKQMRRIKGRISMVTGWIRCLIFRFFKKWTGKNHDLTSQLSDSPCLATKFCITIAFDFSWGVCNTQEKLE